MKKTAVLILVLSLAAVLLAGPGGIPFEILNKGIGIRAVSMGEAGSAVCNDATALFWNPALLESISRNEIYLSVETFYEGANFDYAAFVTPLGAAGGIGLAAGMMNYGVYERVNETGTGLGEASDFRDIFVMAAYGRQVAGRLNAGIAVKGIVKLMGSGFFSGFNADAGAALDINDFLTVGLSFRNMAPLEVKYDYGAEKFVSSLRAGAGLKLFDNTLIIALDAEKYFIDAAPLVYGGLEYKIAGIAAIRAGANTTGELAAGAGISYKDIGFDYGAVYNELALSHKFALSYRFGGYALSLAAEPDTFSPLGGNRRIYLRINAKAKYAVYKWKVDITDSAGKTVKTWQGSGQPDERLIWDGLKPDGMVLDEGEYRAVISITDEFDNEQKSDPVKIKISTVETFNIPLMGD
ncbi:MAG TPA: PorV/PorQ family protein [bacterium]|nr:PorV/PorQ family protein [bacterium]